jgi:1-aminocyclopropane-1-carboxylate deaminase/D-cysteine desulfhydrase-like pyridoxal-dependent ACC family enzyme
LTQNHENENLTQKHVTETVKASSVAALPSLPLGPYISPVEELPRLRQALGGGPRLLVKRDDAIPFAFGGNKVRKMRLVGADAVARGADTLITAGGVQSNHARVTAAAAATLGMKCVLVVNGDPPVPATANALLDALLGADIRYVATRQERAPAMENIAAALHRGGGRPYVIPVGASTPLGAAAFVQAVEELVAQGVVPDAIVHATSSGGTQAGLIGGCVKARLKTRVIGVSADESSAALRNDIREILNGLGPLAGLDADALENANIEVDDRFVGGGYGVPSGDSQEALELAARTEALFLDHTYTAKAMAGLVARVRHGDFTEDQTVLFWHTGGQVGLFR